MPIHFQGVLPHASARWNSDAHKAAFREAQHEVLELKNEDVPHAAVYLHKEGDTVHIGVATDEDARPYETFKALTESLPNVKEALQDTASTNAIALAMQAVPVDVRRAMLKFYEALNGATHAKANKLAHSHDSLPTTLHELNDAFRANYDQGTYRGIADSLHELDDAVQSASRDTHAS